MPFKIKKQDGMFIVVRTDTGQVVSHHDSKKKAAISMSIRERESGEKTSHNTDHNTDHGSDHNSDHGAGHKGKKR